MVRRPVIHRTAASVVAFTIGVLAANYWFDRGQLAYTVLTGTIVAGLGTAMWICGTRLRCRADLPNDACRSCHYDLSGSPTNGRCPECGHLYALD